MFDATTGLTFSDFAAPPGAAASSSSSALPAVHSLSLSRSSSDRLLPPHAPGQSHDMMGLHFPFRGGDGLLAAPHGVDTLPDPGSPRAAAQAQAASVTRALTAVVTGTAITTTAAAGSGPGTSTGTGTATGNADVFGPFDGDDAATYGIPLPGSVGMAASASESHTSVVEAAAAGTAAVDALAAAGARAGKGGGFGQGLREGDAEEREATALEAISSVLG
jgi:hypothetical protein